MNIQDCINHLLIEGTQDDIGAYWVSATAARHGANTPEEIKEVSLQIIHQAISEGFMEIGDIEGIGYDPALPTHYARVVFRPWNLSLHEVMERVDRDWAAAIQSPPFTSPEPGAVCWLVNTRKGNEVARRLIEEQDRWERTGQRSQEP